MLPNIHSKNFHQLLQIKTVLQNPNQIAEKRPWHSKHHTVQNISSSEKRGMDRLLWMRLRHGHSLAQGTVACRTSFHDLRVCSFSFPCSPFTPIFKGRYSITKSIKRRAMNWVASNRIHLSSHHSECTHRCYPWMMFFGNGVGHAATLWSARPPCMGMQRLLVYGQGETQAI